MNDGCLVYKVTYHHHHVVWQLEVAVHQDARRDLSGRDGLEHGPHTHVGLSHLHERRLQSLQFEPFPRPHLARDELVAFPVSLLDGQRSTGEGGRIGHFGSFGLGVGVGLDDAGWGVGLCLGESEERRWAWL